MHFTRIGHVEVVIEEGVSTPELMQSEVSRTILGHATHVLLLYL
jgi:hypothetical protein